MLNRRYPGSFIRTEVIEPLDLPVMAEAEAIKAPRSMLSILLNGKADLFDDVVLRLEKVFGVDMETLIRMQNSCDIAETSRCESRIPVPRYEPALFVQDPKRVGY
jgi:addiction module HigA family antidote